MIDPIEEPQAYYHSLPLQGQQVWDRQQRFLAAYSTLGKLNLAAQQSDIPVATVDSWQLRDMHGFKKRLQQAQQVYVETWEEEMDRRLLDPKGNRGSDILLMFKLKAVAPEKYREEVKVMGLGAPLQILDKLREMGDKEVKRRELEEPSVEGQWREVKDD